MRALATTNYASAQSAGSLDLKQGGASAAPDTLQQSGYPSLEARTLSVDSEYRSDRAGMNHRGANDQHDVAAASFAMSSNSRWNDNYAAEAPASSPWRERASLAGASVSSTGAGCRVPL